MLSIVRCKYNRHSFIACFFFSFFFLNKNRLEITWLSQVLSSTKICMNLFHFLFSCQKVNWLTASHTFIIFAGVFQTVPRVFASHCIENRILGLITNIECHLTEPFRGLLEYSIPFSGCNKLLNKIRISQVYWLLDILCGSNYVIVWESSCRLILCCETAVAG